MFDSKIAGRLGKYFANWVCQVKKFTLEKTRTLKMIPVLHSMGDHSLFDDVEDTFCYAIKAKKDKKEYYRKPIFDVVNKKKTCRQMG